MSRLTEEGEKLIRQLNNSDMDLLAGDIVKLLPEVTSPMLLSLGVQAKPEVLLVYYGDTYICRVAKHAAHLYFED